MAMATGTAELPKGRIDRNSPVPFYFQLKSVLSEEILSGRWSPGVRLPSEPSIGDHFGVSRTTVRQTLDHLEGEGLIRREKGRGTFVAEVAPESWFLQSSQGFYDEAVRRGHEVTSQVLRRELEDLPSWAADALQLGDHERGVSLERLRWMDGVLVMYVINHLPSRFAETVLTADLETGSLYRALANSHGVTIAGGRRVVEAVAADDDVSRLLDVPEGSPLLYVHSVSWDDDGAPVECYRAWHRPDRTKIEVQVVHEDLARGVGIDRPTIRWGLS